MREQQQVAEFVDEHDIETRTEFRLLDLVEEIGEIAEDAVETAEYGGSPNEIDVSSNELGDALFIILQIANSAEIDASEALNDSLNKYEQRIAETGDPSSRSDQE